MIQLFQTRYMRFFALCIVTVAFPRLCEAQITDKMVKDKITEFQNAIIKTQKGDGSWAYGGYPVGITALNLLALKYSLIPNDHPAVVNAINYILNNNDDRVYSESLVPCALELVSRSKYKERIRQSVSFLERAQTQDGCWSYRGNGGRSGDNSNAQFAVLGLAAAERCGLHINPQVKSKAKSYWKKVQAKEGGWGYTTAQNPRLSMTCAGIASLFLLGEKLEYPSTKCGSYKKSTAMKVGLESMTKQLELGGFGRGHTHYTRYAVERVGIFLDIKKFGETDWYMTGVDDILNGRPTTRISDIAFQLLFLAKGFKGIAIAKWKWGTENNKDWNNDHYDVQNWVKLGSKTFETEMDYLIDPINELTSPAAKASIIYANGHKTFTTTEEQRAFLRSFLEKGGTLVGEACCDSKEFTKSFINEISKKLYPGTRFIPVGSDHELCSIQHKITSKQLSAYQLKKGCKKYRIIIVTKDISCALNGEHVPTGETTRAQKVAMNILGWGLKSKKADKKFDTTELEEVEIESSLTADKVTVSKSSEGILFSQPMGRLQHKGEYSSDPHFYDQLKAFLKNSPALPQFDGQVIVPPESESLFEMALLFSTGHKDPQFTAKQLLHLRTYLTTGGFILSSSCCSERAYHNGMVKGIKSMFKNDELEPIPFTDPIYSTPFIIGEDLELTDEGNRIFKDSLPRLYGIKRDNRWIVIHSPIDLCCAIEGDLDNQTAAYKKDTAYKLITNIINYTFSAW